MAGLWEELWHSGPFWLLVARLLIDHPAGEPTALLSAGLEDRLRSLREQQERIERLTAPYGDIVRRTIEATEARAAIAGPGLEAMRSLDAAMAPYREMIESANQVTRSLREAILGPTQLASLASISVPLKSEFDQQNAYAAGVTTHLREALGSKAFDAAGTLRLAILPDSLFSVPQWSALEDLAGLARGTSPANLRAAVAALSAVPQGSFAPTVTSEGIVVDDELIAAEAINEQLSNALQRDGDVDGRLLAYVRALLPLLRTLPPRVGQAIAALAIFVIVSATAGEVQYYTGEILAPVRRTIMKEVRGLFAQHVPARQRRSLRIVTAKSFLNVREHPHTSGSRILGTLPFGTVVVVVRHRKDWTLVEYSTGDTVIRGWAFTRYLKRIDDPR